MPKKCFGSAGPKRRAEESAEKVLRAPCLCRGSRGDGTPSTFSALSSAPRFGPALPKHFFGTLPGRGFGTSLDGRHDRKARRLRGRTLRKGAGAPSETPPLPFHEACHARRKSVSQVLFRRAMIQELGVNVRFNSP